MPAGYTVNVSRIAPLAQNISQAGSDLLDEEGKPYLLIQPVIQVRTWKLKLSLVQQPCHGGQLLLGHAAVKLLYAQQTYQQCKVGIRLQGSTALSWAASDQQANPGRSPSVQAASRHMQSACADARADGSSRAACVSLPQVFGRMNKTIEGVPVEEGASYVNKYFLLPTDIKSTDTITLSLDEGELEEGYYHMSAKVRAQMAWWPYSLESCLPWSHCSCGMCCWVESNEQVPPACQQGLLLHAEWWSCCPVLRRWL